MKRLCDVPRCPQEGIEEVIDDYMRKRHAIQWDRANAKGSVFDPHEFIGETTPEEDAAAECQSRWLGKRR